VIIILLLQVAVIAMHVQLALLHVQLLVELGAKEIQAGCVIFVSLHEIFLLVMQ
jgi:hypothetical protein